jgi:hypothetical protein
MIALLSSAKTMDFTSGWKTAGRTVPECLQESRLLMDELRKLSVRDIGSLMGVSPKIARLNADRFRQFSIPFTAANAKPALLAYQGDVYRGMEAQRFGAEEMAFAQRTLRILSGLYGVLRPLDLIQPYRLEMAVRLSGPRWKDLYAFWSDRVTDCIDRDSVEDGGLIVNLASQEYFRVLDANRLKSRVLHIVFKQDRRGRIEMVPILAKRARGFMARDIVLRRAENPESLKEFATDGYRFAPKLSTEKEWVFVRRAH